jgi:hypothetical protein
MIVVLGKGPNATPKPQHYVAIASLRCDCEAAVVVEPYIRHNCNYSKCVNKKKKKKEMGGGGVAIPFVPKMLFYVGKINHDLY